MKFIKRNAINIGAALAALLIGLSAVAVMGQDGREKTKIKYKDSYARGFCKGNNYWSGDDGVSARELRELTTSATGKIAVESGQNGGIAVIGEDRSDVLVRACVNAMGKSDEIARTNVAATKISLAGAIKAENLATDRWSVSYEIRVPRSSDLDLQAHNGGISVESVNGAIAFETINGGVNLKGVAGSVKGRTTNGGVNVTLVGNGWQGSGLDVETTNGGVNLNVPANFAARVEASTVNGGLTSNIVGLQPEKASDEGYYRPRPKKVNAEVNGGGPLVRAVTVNGGVRINTLVD